MRIMNKILSFIINEKNELLLLKGSPSDPQYKKSLWYVVTGGCESIDVTKQDTVKREIKEETGLDTEYILYLNWILKYNSLGIECTEYAFISFVKKNEIVLNEENIDYKWCDLDEFMKKIDWFGYKNLLRNVLEKGINKNLFFDKESIIFFK